MDHCAECLRAALAAAEAKLELQGYEYTKALAETELALGADIHALEVKLADERRHADSLVAPQACDGSGTILVPHYTIEGEDAGESWEQCEGCCACAAAHHDARRAAAAPLSDAGASSEVANG